jgi:DNA-binding NtrC family response regulator
LVEVGQRDADDPFGRVDSQDSRIIAGATTADRSRGVRDLPFVWASQAMDAVIKAAGQIGASDAKLLIGGETGSGKDGIARYVHASSARCRRHLVTVNCAALSETLLESELFGHVRGSFTGAYRDKIGQVQRAHHGTLFLDEVGEMSARMQALLLRFLEDGEVRPVGAERPRTRVDVRIIAATNVDLDDRVAAGRFRSDLLYRLRVIYLRVPPLRDRPEDIPVLVKLFLTRAPAPISVSDAAMQLLVEHRWPGNVRELRNVIEQVIARAPGAVIQPSHLPPGVLGRASIVRGDAERRRQVADDLYHALVSGQCSFWDDIYPLFLLRDMTRQDLRELVQRGLAKARGNYRALLTLFGLPQEDYKRFLNFLTAHDCGVDFRPFRVGEEQPRTRAPRLLLPAAHRKSVPSENLAHDSSQ